MAATLELADGTCESFSAGTSFAWCPASRHVSGDDVLQSLGTSRSPLRLSTRNCHSSGNTSNLLKINRRPRLYPELRAPVHPQFRPETQVPVPASSLEPPASRTADHLRSNRYTERLELRVSHRKQRTAYSSNRYRSLHRPSHALRACAHDRQNRASAPRQSLTTSHYSPLPW